MNIERIIRNGLRHFNSRQKESRRIGLGPVELNMLVQVLQSALAEEMGKIRDELELAASQANNETLLELDWATDIIVATMRMNNLMSVELTDEQIQKYAGGFVLTIERDEGVTELELITETEYEKRTQ